MIRKSMLVVLLLLLLVGAGGLASAQPQTITFQCVPQSTCVVDVVTFTGGMATYTNSAYSATQGPLYHTSGHNRLQGRTYPEIWKNFLDEAYWNVELKS